MNRGVAANTFMGMVVALLPFYLRFSKYQQADVLSKENLLFFILMGYLAIDIDRVRKCPAWLFAACSYFAVVATWKQYEPASGSIFIHSAWVFVAGSFVVKFYETFDTGSSKRLVDGIAIGCLLQSAMCLLDYFGIHYRDILTATFPNLRSSDEPFTVSLGTLGNTNHAGAYLAITAMALLRRRWCWTLPLPALAILNSSEMPVATFIGGVSYAAYLRRDKLPKFLPYIAVVAAFAACVHFGLVEKFGSGRQEAWEKALELYPKTTFGHGTAIFMDDFRNHYLLPGGNYMQQEHNEFLAAFIAFGVVGLSIIVGIFFIASGATGTLAPMLFAAFCNFFGHFTMHQSTTAIVVLIALAACLVEAKEKDHVFNLAR